MRPKEIQELIDWLREPGRELARFTWEDKKSGCVCAHEKLMRILGSTNVGAGFADITDRQDAMRKRIGMSEAASLTLHDLSDKNSPLELASYLEAEFPQ